MASTYLSRTIGTATDNKKATFSFWIKRGRITNRQMFVRIINPSSTAAYSYIEFDGTTDTLTYDDFDGSSTRITRSTSQVFRDVSSWYHIVISVDTTQATGSDRAKVYVNGEQVTSFASTSDATQNYVLTGQTNGKTFYIGAAGDVPSLYFDGSMAHFHFIDGTAYDASTFGETDATTGIWKPKTAPSVTYGTNGFFLKFENSGAFGTDSSGNANNFTVNGTMTQTIDTPSNVFATMNPLVKLTDATLSQGNNSVTYGTASTRRPVFGTFAVSQGKYYWETKITATSTANVEMNIGISNTYNPENIGNALVSANGYSVSYFTGGNLYIGNTQSQTGLSNLAVNDILGFALDLDASTLQFYLNGSTFGSPVSISSQTSGEIGGWTPAVSCSSGAETFTCAYNFGNGYFGTTAVSSAQNPDDGIGIFEYTVPTGYRALCTKSINAEEYS